MLTADDRIWLKTYLRTFDSPTIEVKLDDDDVFIERPGLPDEGMLCGYLFNEVKITRWCGKSVCYDTYVK